MAGARKAAQFRRHEAFKKARGSVSGWGSGGGGAAAAAVVVAVVATTTTTTTMKETVGRWRGPQGSVRGTWCVSRRVVLLGKICGGGGRGQGGGKEGGQARSP